jgi:hypothetical protein
MDQALSSRDPSFLSLVKTPMTHAHWFHQGRSMFILTIPNAATQGLETQEFEAYRYVAGENPLDTRRWHCKLRGDEVTIFDIVPGRAGSIKKEPKDMGKVARNGEIIFDMSNTKWIMMSGPPKSPHQPITPSEPPPPIAPNDTHVYPTPAPADMIHPTPVPTPAPAPAPAPTPAPVVPVAPTMPEKICPEVKDCPVCPDKTIALKGMVSGVWKTAAIILGILSFLLMFVVLRTFLKSKKQKDVLPTAVAVTGPTTTAAAVGPATGGQIDLNCSPVVKPAANSTNQRTTFFSPHRYPQSASGNYRYEP